MERGDLVIVRDGKDVFPGVVVVRRAGTVELAVGAGRPRALPVGRVVLELGRACPAQTADDAGRWLVDWKAELARARETVDLAPAWSFYLELGGDASLAELTDLLNGAQATALDRAALYFALEEDARYFRRKQDRYQPRTAEEVHQRQAGEERVREKERTREALVDRLARGRRGEAVGPVDPAHASDVADLRELALGREETTAGRRAARLLAELKCAAGPEGAFKTLVTLGAIGPDAHLALEASGLAAPHPERAVAEARALAGRPFGADGRVDLRDREAVAIDEPWTTDPDDAVSVEPLADGAVRVWIHVTDVSGLVAPGGAIDAGAFERGASVYLPDGRWSMLPAEAEAALALTAGHERAALTLEIEVDRDGEIRAEKTYASAIRVVRQATYDEVDRAIVTGASPWAELEVVRNAMAARRLAAGALSFQLPEARVLLEAGTVRLVPIPSASPARALVAELMVTANARWAELARAAGLAVVYRRQDRVGGELPRREDYAGDLPYFFAVRRLLPRGHLSAEPGPHAGLGLDCYVQATSPLRRYQDLVTQRQLAAHLAGTPPPHDAAFVLRASGAADQAARDIGALERDRVAHWMMRYLEARIGSSLGATILGELPGHRYAAMLDEVLLEHPVRSDTPLAPGSRVRVRIDGVSVHHRQVHVHVEAGAPEPSAPASGTS